MKTLLACLYLTTACLHADFKHEAVPYQLDDTLFEGHLIYDSARGENQPVLLMVPNWMGPSENAFTKARMLAGKGYAVFVADLYGVEVRPTNTQESAAAAGFVRSDRPMMRARALKAVEVVQQLAADHPLDAERILAIGFCFGGGTVLELARSGTDEVRGVVSFHGNLDTPDPADAENIQVPVLVLHGADDPYVPQAQIDDFFSEMQNAGVDFQFVAFGGAVHSFTNPKAASDDAGYHERSAKRAFEMLYDFAEEVL